jgi:hypothetical protein
MVGAARIRAAGFIVDVGWLKVGVKRVEVEQSMKPGRNF